MKKGEPDQEATRILQQALKDLKYKMPISFAKGGPDGIYGDETAATVRKFQIDQKFPPSGWDGRAGHDTLGRLDQLFPAPPGPGPQPAVTVRQNVFRMSPTEQQRYINVIRQLNDPANNVYGTVVNFHRNMNFNMHAMNGGMPRGRMRFLPWHRIFVRHLEKEMQKIDPAAFVPFWYWQSSDPAPYPAWLDAFVGMAVNLPPLGAAAARTVTVSRSPGTKQELTRLAAPVGTIAASSTFLVFTRDLEDSPHNLIHDWFGPGSTMADIGVSPCDPIFWTHHGEVDRQWALWQASHPGLNPDFSVPPPGQPDGRGSLFFNQPGDEIMTPIPVPNREDQFRDVRASGYTYAAP